MYIILNKIMSIIRRYKENIRKQNTEQSEGYIQYKLAKDLYSNNNFEEAFKLFKKSAVGGNADAYNCIGIIYYNGTGIQQSYQRAAKYFKISAKKNNIHAQKNLANLYSKGIGIIKNEKMILIAFQKVAKEGI